WPLIAPASPTNTSRPSEISVRKVKLTSATGVTSAERAAIAWGTKPAAPARANNNTSSFTSVSFLVARNRSLDTTLGSRAGGLHDLGQAATKHPPVAVKRQLRPAFWGRPPRSRWRLRMSLSG